MDSLEKLNQLLAGAGELQPEDEEQARYFQALQMAAPFLPSFIPETAEELDGLLLGLLRWTIDLRSDEAPPEPLTEAIAEALKARTVRLQEVTQ